MKKIKDCSLYLVISGEYAKGKSADEIAKAAITGGVDIIQMREKNKPEAELLELGNGLSRLCKDKDVTFIVNDDPCLAKKLDADGVHLGQEDMKRFGLEKARKIIGKDKIIGVSTHSLEQFKAANKSDVDYIAFGPVFPTKTKDYHIGTEGIKAVLEEAKKAVFFIGGINLSNMDEILAMGAKNIALIRGVLEADDIASKTAKFKTRLNRKREPDAI